MTDATKITSEWAFERAERLEDDALAGAVLDIADLCLSNAESVGCVESANAARCLRGTLAAVLDRFAEDAFAVALTRRVAGGGSDLDEGIAAARAELGALRERVNELTAATGQETPIVCVECGRESVAGETGWRTYLTVDDEPASYCPACAREEFGDA